MEFEEQFFRKRKSSGIVYPLLDLPNPQKDMSTNNSFWKTILKRESLFQKKVR